ncbi:hypothetical protein [Streptacidiphilus rugosus]|uniref:hypothetical protein n=1 Tax=Streptacidiphilus rugosus TaxID=405783 RepID=UPI00055E33D6|nr:hypothetical protein [Streptacidiphilus rugosus]
MSEAVLRPVPPTDPQLTGYDGVPWPEFLRSRPALVVPQPPGLIRVLNPGQGWSSSPQAATGPVHPDWQLALTGRRLTGPGPGPWYDGNPLLTRDWIRAARAQHQVLLVSGQFTSIDQFAAAAAGGALQLLHVRVR